jgi:protoporphyrinogen oxidase
LRYRTLIVVCLIIDLPHLFADNWIYVHEPRVKVGRIQNYGNWSQGMIPDGNHTGLGLEYFCDEGDEFWELDDHEIISRACRELELTGLCTIERVVDGLVLRAAKSYPVYDGDYRQSVAEIRRFLNGIENLQTIGRNGLHRYNNQDHAMVTGILAARNLLLGEKHDVWEVNTDRVYHESDATLAAAHTSELDTRCRPGVQSPFACLVTEQTITPST